MPASPRIPLDRVMIELTPDGFDEPFPTDGINLGVGGLSLRSAILPDIGTQLRCRFDAPSGGEVSAVCEVMWAHDSGPQSGEVGLRFISLPASCKAELESAVSDWNTMLQDFEEDAAVPEPVVLPAEMMTLNLDGVRSSIVAQVAEQSNYHAVVEQELPFLSIGKGVQSDDGRRGTLEGVDLRLQEGTPRLVLTIGYEHPDVHAAKTVKAAVVTESRSADATWRQETEVPSQEPALSDEELGQNTAETQSSVQLVEANIAEQPAAVESAEGVLSAQTPPVEAEPAREVSPLEGSQPLELGTVEAPSREMTQSFRVETPDADELAFAETNFEPEWRKTVRSKLSAVSPFVMRLRAGFVAFAGKLSPRFRGWFASFSERTKEAKPAVAARFRTVRRMFQVLVSRATASIKNRKSGRRKTTAPARRSSVTPKREESDPGFTPLQKWVRRIAVVSLPIGFAMLCYAIWGGGVDEDFESEELSIAEIEEGPTAAEEMPAPVLAAPPQAAPVAQAAPVLVPPVSNLSEVSPAAGAVQAGPIAAPTFPSVQAAIPTEPVAEVPAEEVILPSVGKQFGHADVPNSRTFTLRMSRRIEQLSGRPTPDGFAVEVKGALSLDRASPIAVNLPSVSKAGILNDQGNSNSELRIRFKEGRRPKFRVVAKGFSLIVTVER